MTSLDLISTRRPRRRLLPLASLLLAAATLSGCVRKQPPPKSPDAVQPVSQNAAVVAEPARDPELMQLRAAPVREALPTAGGELIVRLRVDTRALPDSTRPPVNLALVIDTSSSMAGDGIEGARAAALELLSAMREGDRLSVVSFGSRARLVVPSTRVDASSRGELKTAIEGLEPSGTTALTEGLNAGLNQVFTHEVQGGINRVVLLSDGVPNDGGQVAALAQSAAGRGVSITALGLGLEFDETLLAALAQRSGGRFHYLESSDQVAAVFTDEVLRMQRVVGRNLALTLAPGPGVQIREVLGTPTSQASRGVVTSLGDLSEGETRDVFVKLQVGEHREGATVELLDARLEFDDMVKNSGRHAREDFVSARATDDEAALERGLDLELRSASERALAATAIVGAVAAMRANQPAQARVQLKAARARIEPLLERAPQAERGALEEQLAEIAQLDEECEKAEQLLAARMKELEEQRRALEKERRRGGGGTGIVKRDYAPPPPMPVPMSAPARRSHARAMKALQAN